SSGLSLGVGQPGQNFLIVEKLRNKCGVLIDPDRFEGFQESVFKEFNRSRGSHLPMLGVPGLPVLTVSDLMGAVHIALETDAPPPLRVTPNFDGPWRIPGKK
ncbi:MAG: hypothetical protein AB7O04_15250, partial [Hyphomonadaceae bacterium]